MQDTNLVLNNEGVLTSALIRVQRKDLTQAQRNDLLNWASHLRINRGLSENTARNYIVGMVQFFEWINDKQISLSELTRDVVETWMRHNYLVLGQKSSTRHGKAVALRRFLNWREEVGVEKNPVRFITGPKREQTIPRKFTRTQVQKILTSIDTQTLMGIRDRAIILLFLFSGARRSEIAGLDLHQLELREKTGAARLLGKGQKERIVPFEGPPVAALHTWLAARERLPVADHNAVFLALRGQYLGCRLGISGFDNLIQRVIKKAGFTFGRGVALHTLRSTYATAMFDSGFNIEAIRILLGHRDINTTRQYLVISNQQLKTRLPGSFFGIGESQCYPRNM